MSCIKWLSKREETELLRIAPEPILKALGEAIDQYMPTDENGVNDEWSTLRDGLDRMAPIIDKLWQQAQAELIKRGS